eukprot:941472_1
MSQPTGQLIPQMVSQMNAERSEYCDFEKKVRALPSELPRVDAVDNLPLSNLNCRNFQRYRGPLEPSNPASRRCSRPKAGRVKWFNARRGFGYIVVDQPPEEVYVHAVDVLKAPQVLHDGERVRFYIADDNGPSRRAVEVVPLHDVTQSFQFPPATFAGSVPVFTQSLYAPPGPNIRKKASKALKITDPKSKKK